MGLKNNASPSLRPQKEEKRPQEKAQGDEMHFGARKRKVVDLNKKKTAATRKGRNVPTNKKLYAQ